MNFLLLKISSLFVLFSVTLCYSNYTFLSFDYWPSEFCNVYDPWNQSAFGGHEFPLYLLILKNAGWNLSEIAFKCILSDGDIYEAYGSLKNPSPYDYYVGGFDGWFSPAMNYPWQFLQPNHEYILVAAGSYKKPFWIFFQNFEADILILLFATPIIIGFFFKFLNTKHQRYYQISDYIGLVFFQPEIITKRNISSKIISLVFQLLTMIVLAVFCQSLQISFNEMRTFGGRTIENGLQDVRIYTIYLNVYRVMASTLMKPIPINYWLGVDDWKEFIETHEGGTFLFESYIQQLLSYQNCDTKYIGDIFYVASSIFFGRGTRQEFTDLSASVLDTIEFRQDYYPIYNYTELLTSDQIKCKIKNPNIFQYTLNDFSQLWIIYAIGCGVAVLVRFLRPFFDKNKSNHLGILENRTNYFKVKISGSLHHSMLWLRTYQLYFTYFRPVQKFRKIREHLMNKNPAWLKEIKAARTKVVARHVKRSKNRFYVRYIRWLIIFIAKAKVSKKIGKPFSKMPPSEIHKLLPKNQRRNIKNSRKNQLIPKIIEGYIVELIKCSLRECLFEALRLSHICDIAYESKLQRYYHTKGFIKTRLIKLKNSRLKSYKVDAKTHSKLNKMFSNKVIETILHFKLHPLNIKRKKIKKHQKQLQYLVESSVDQNLGECLLNIFTALNYILKTKKRIRQRNLAQAAGINQIRELICSANNLKQYQFFFFVIFQLKSIFCLTQLQTLSIVASKKLKFYYLYFLFETGYTKTLYTNRFFFCIG